MPISDWSSDVGSSDVALAAVAREDVEIFDRDVELVAAGVSERDAVVRAAADRNLGQPLIAADAMIQVDDEIADAERREFGEEGVGALAAFLAADETLAEDILFGEQADHVGGEAVVERKDDHRGRAAAFR